MKKLSVVLFCVMVLTLGQCTIKNQQGKTEMSKTMKLSTSEANSDKLYALLYSKLATKYGAMLDANTAYQFPVEKTEALWAAGTTAEWLAFQTGDRMPIASGGVYAPRTNKGASVFKVYTDWIAKIDTPLNSSNPVVQGYKNSMQIELQKKTKLMENSYNAYVAWKTNNPVPAEKLNTYDLWLASDYGSAFSGEIAECNEKIADYAAKIKQYRETSDKALSDTISMNNPPDGTNPNYRAYTSPDLSLIIVAGRTNVVNQNGSTLADDLSAWRGGNRLAKWPARLDTKILPVHKFVTITQTVYNKESYFFGLFKSTSVSYKQITKEITEYENFYIDIEIAGLAYYTVNRAPWFDDTLLATYKEYALTPPEAAKDYFNKENGFLTLIPMGMIIGWNPTFKLTVSERFYNNYKSVIDEGNGLSVGSMLVSGIPEVIDGPEPESKILIYKTPKEKLNTINPQILGYVHYKTIVD